MASNYRKIIDQNLQTIFQKREDDLERFLPARREGQAFRFQAFGEGCVLGPEGILLSDLPEQGPRAIVVTLYARSVGPEPIRLEPFLSFKDLPGSMPYQGAFTANAERPLIPLVEKIDAAKEAIAASFDGAVNAPGEAGDFSLLLYPFPKIALCYIFYRQDEEFPPSASCLFSANAGSFMSTDGLADVGEYTTKRLLEICKQAAGSKQ
jgi:hypothetical protein